MVHNAKYSAARSVLNSEENFRMRLSLTHTHTHARARARRELTNNWNGFNHHVPFHILQRTRKRHVLTDKLGDNGTRLKTFPWKCFTRSTQQRAISATSARNASISLYFHPYTKRVVRKLSDTEQETQRNVVNWHLQKVGPYAGEILPTLSLLAMKLVVISLYFLLELSK